MLLTPQTFDDVSRNVVEDFLQTVVLIDDRAYFGDESSDEETKNVPDAQLVVPGPGDAQPISDKVEAAKAEYISHKLNAKLMIEVFAERGLVCGVLRPQSPQTFADLMKQTLRAVRRADIVVIDWMLEAGIGTALETIGRIIDEDEKQCAGLRLIAVYTGEAGLLGIAEQLKNGLLDKNGLPSFEYVNKDKNTLTLVNGQVRIAIYAKKDTRVQSEHKYRVLTIEELPDALINEYAETTKGLVSNVALASLAALRRHTHLLLDKMNNKLDAPYMAHRVSIEHPDEAADLLIAIVGAELQSILDQAQVANQANLENTMLWLEAQKFDYTKQFAPITSENWPDIIRKLVAKGHKHDDVKLHFSPPNKPGLGQTKKSAKQFCDDSNTDNIEAEFAMLTTLRSRYDTPLPILTLGQILHKQTTVEGEVKDEYWMCVQPPCDSVRIKESKPDEGKRAFSLLPMTVVPVTSSKNDPGNVFVVKHSQGQYVHLKPEYNPHKCQMVVFAADPTAQQVIATKRDDDTFCFTSNQQVCYDWIAQLKPDSAQHVANEYAATISRVGRDISEWLRTYPK